MSEKYPNAFNRPDDEISAIYADGEHLVETVDTDKIVARWLGKLVDLPLQMAEPTTPENWEDEDRNSAYIDFREAA